MASTALWYHNFLLFSVIPSQGPNKENSRTASPVEDEGPDVVASVIGQYGRWQLLMTFLLSLFSLPCTFHIYLPTFTVSEAHIASQFE